MEHTTTAPAHTPTPWFARRIPWADGTRQWQIATTADPRPEYAAATAVVALTERYNLHTGWFDETAANAAFIVRACNAHAGLRKASQDLYDRLQEYLDVSDEQLIEQGHGDLVLAMDALEAAWRTADGNPPDSA